MMEAQYGGHGQSKVKSLYKVEKEKTGTANRTGYEEKSMVSEI